MTINRRPVVGGIAALLTVLVVSYGGLLIASAYQAHRASRMLRDVQGIKIGETEEAIKPILDRNGAFRWDSNNFASGEQYSYSIVASPWNLLDIKSLLQGGRPDPIRTRIADSSVRRHLGMPLWLLDCGVGIKDGKVVVVETSIVVEGRNRWLGSSVRLAEQPMERKSNWMDHVEPDTTFFSPWNLSMNTGGGSLWHFWINPSSSLEKRQLVHNLNLSCLSSFGRCRNMCELMPDARQFFEAHPDLTLGYEWAAHCSTAGENQYSR